MLKHFKIFKIVDDLVILLKLQIKFSIFAVDSSNRQI